MSLIAPNLPQKYRVACVAPESEADISQRLFRAQERERQRIAIELHDSTSQHLVAMGLNLMMLKHQIGDRAGVQDIIRELEDSLEQAQREIQVISYLTHPVQLETQGLAASLTTFVAGFCRRTGIVGDVGVERTVDAISPEIQHAALRLVQEALANVHKHACASRVEVSVAIESGGLTIRIQDNGRGMAASAGGRNAGTAVGLGICGMRTRIGQLGGVFRIKSGRAGTMVTAHVPLAGSPRERADDRRAIRGRRLANAAAS